MSCLEITWRQQRKMCWFNHAEHWSSWATSSGPGQSCPVTLDQQVYSSVCVFPAYFCTWERILCSELNNASGRLNFPILLQRTGKCSSSYFLPTLSLSPTNPTQSFYGKRAAHTSSTHWSIAKMLQPRCGLRGCISPSGVCSTMSPHLLSTYTSIPPALFIKPFWPCSQSKSLASPSSAHWRHNPILKGSAGILCGFSWFVNPPWLKPSPTQ